MHYLLFYDYVHDYLKRREEYREQHLALAWQAVERGELVLGGVVDDPVDGAVLFFNSESKQLIEDFVKADPYVINGLVKSWRIRPWNTVVGREAINQVKA